MKSLYLAEIGHVDEEIMKTLEIGLWQIFGFDIQRLARLPEPVYALDTGRKQYSSALILKELLKVQKNDMIRILGVTTHDLFIPMLSFVFGHAQLGGSAALISLSRLQQEYYHLPANNELLLSRSLKEAVHELGHTFGLIHCSDTHCAMSLSNTINLVDAKTEDLCDSCSLILQQQILQIYPANGTENKK